MKKEMFFGGLLVVIGFLMSSCEQRVVNYTNWQIVDCYVGYNEYTKWEYASDAPEYQYSNHYFWNKYSIPQLSSFVFTDGNVQVYLMRKNAYGEETQQPLPFTRHYESFIGDSAAYYTETYDYLYGVGWIEFNYTASDFKYEDSQGEMDRPEPQHFRVVLTW